MIKYTYLALIACFCFTTAAAQNVEETLDDYGRIALNSYIPEESTLTSGTRRLMNNKLNKIITKQGLGDSGTDSRFIITTNIFETSKDILGTAPPMHAITLEVGFYIGDGIEGKLFSSMSKSVRGVGTNPTKAQINALKNIKSSDPEFVLFISEAKEKILAYYKTQCAFILNEARTKLESRTFDDAVLTLVKIPSVCKDCYEKSLALTKEIQLAKMEYKCQENINKARSSIAQNQWEEAADHIALYTPDFECYSEVRTLIMEITDHQCSVYLGKAKGAWNSRDAQLAGSFLSNIPSDSNCADEANSLGKTIANSLDAAARRKWELAYEKYNRNQTLKENKSANDISLDNRRQRENEKDGKQNREITNRNQTLKEMNSANDILLANREMSYKENQGFDLEKARIKAARDVGVAYGRNQPKTKVSYNVNGWR